MFNCTVQFARVLQPGVSIFQTFKAAAIPVGIAQAALDASFPYAHERKQFGKRIGEFQLIQATVPKLCVGGFQFENRNLKLSALA